jgi:PleD family two-component response regulator
LSGDDKFEEQFELKRNPHEGLLFNLAQGAKKMEIWNQGEQKTGLQIMMPKVLVVEDAPEFQLMIKSALGKGLFLEMCSSIGDARQKIQQEQFDLILLDVSLPDGSGF